MNTIQKFLYLCVITFALLLSACEKNPSFTPDVPECEDVDPIINPGDNIVFDQPSAAPQPEAYLPVSWVNPELFRALNRPDRWMKLLELSNSASAASSPFEVYLGLIGGEIADADLQFQTESSNPEVYEVLSTIGMTPNTSGLYAAVEMVFVFPEIPNDNVIKYYQVEPEFVANNIAQPLTGGSCAVLATAHSLVRKMGQVVQEADATKVNEDGVQIWDPDFLSKIREASGDDDSTWGLSDGEAEQAHTDDGWSDDVDIIQEDDDEALYDDSEGDPTCETIEERCNTLMKRLDDKNDVSMRVWGSFPNGNPLRHRVAVEKATFNESDCCCEITVIPTSQQGDGGNQNVPYKPDTNTYSICEDDVANEEFPGATIEWLAFDSFKAEERE